MQSLTLIRRLAPLFLSKNYILIRKSCLTTLFIGHILLIISRILSQIPKKNKCSGAAAKTIFSHIVNYVTIHSILYFTWTV